VSNSKIMLVGMGQLGGRVLDMLVREPACKIIIVLGRDHNRLQARANLAVLAAVQAGHDPSVICETCDVLNVDKLATIIDLHAPDIVFNATSLQSWWVITNLPSRVYEHLATAQLGPWLPMHLTLTHALMQAVGKSHAQPKVLNASFPDVVNVVLSRVGLGPIIGIGNVANPIPALRKAVAITTDASLDRVDVRLVAHHYVSHRLPQHGDTGGAPYHFCALLDDEDITEKLDVPSVWRLLSSRFRRTGGTDGTAITAESAMTVLRAMLYDTGTVVHAPGPNGLPGGYPVRVNARTVSLALPTNLGLAAAIAINEEGQRYDGIERIELDGTTVFAKAQMDVMEQMLGYRAESMTLGECEIFAAKLITRYERFARQYQPREIMTTGRLM
jgi:hypothetical protein